MSERYYACICEFCGKHYDSVMLGSSCCGKCAGMDVETETLRADLTAARAERDMYQESAAGWQLAASKLDPLTAELAATKEVAFRNQNAAHDLAQKNKALEAEIEAVRSAFVEIREERDEALAGEAIAVRLVRRHVARGADFGPDIAAAALIEAGGAAKQFLNDIAVDKAKFQHERDEARAELEQFRDDAARYEAKLHAKLNTQATELERLNLILSGMYIPLTARTGDVEAARKYAADADKFQERLQIDRDEAREQHESLHAAYRRIYALWCRVARAMTPPGGPDITDEEVAERAEKSSEARAALGELGECAEDAVHDFGHDMIKEKYKRIRAALARARGVLGGKEEKA